MRLHPGVGGHSDVPCRVLVGGYGSPGCRDLGFGERFVRLAEVLEWPAGVVVEDLSCSAHLVLHRLQELRPAKLILVGAVPRGVDRPGAVRRYRAGPPAPAADEVHAGLTAAIGGGGLDVLLSVAGHFGALPPDTVVLEVEAADVSLGLGFSDEVAAAIDPLLDAVRHELRDLAATQMETAPATANGRPGASHPASCSPGRAPGRAEADAALPGIDQLFRYAEAHARVRALEAMAERLPAAAGLAVGARFVPAGRGLGLSADWYDALPLPGGALGVAVAGVPAGHRLAAASVAAQLRMAVHALALLEGSEPGRLMGHLDTLVAGTGVGREATLLYLVVEGAGGRDPAVRMASAGHCPPLVLTPAGRASFVAHRWAGPLGAGGPRGGGPAGGERTVAVEPGSTVLLFTGGLVRAGDRSLDAGLQCLRAAAEEAPADLDDLCDHVLGACLAGAGPAGEDDVTLLAVRVAA